jgi:hypothetical protein
VAGCCECGDEPSGSCATKLVYMTGTGELEASHVLMSGRRTFIRGK